MPQGTYYFPNGFLWGAATSSHQVEGRNTNNQWYAWEQQPGHIYQDQRSGVADDWWSGRWKEDFDRAAEAGQNAHRLSIEWSRVQPTPDRWDEQALDYYREMMRGLVKRGMTPMVTLHHFTDPLWLAERGGWESDETPGLFAAYAVRVVEALKEYANLWVTINEPNVYTYGGYLNGGFPPGKNDTGAAYMVMRNMLRGHALAYHAIHDEQVQARVGLAHHYRGFRPARMWLPMDRVMAGILSQNFNESFGRALVDGRFRFIFKGERIPEAAKTQDFIGLNYYTTELVAFNPFKTGDFFTSRELPQRRGPERDRLHCQRARRNEDGAAVGLQLRPAHPDHRERRGRLRPTRCGRAIWWSTCTRSGRRSTITGRSRATSTGLWWTTSSGSAAGRSASGCGVWTWTRRRASAASPPICTQPSAKRTPSRMRWWRNMRPRRWSGCFRGKES